MNCEVLFALRHVKLKNRTFLSKDRLNSEASGSTQAPPFIRENSTYKEIYQQLNITLCYGLTEFTYISVNIFF